MYLVFGVLTTAVSWVVYFAIMWGGRAIFDIPADSLYGGDGYIALYTAAQIVSWLCAVLFAFYTNRKWVFTDADKSASVTRQLTVFASGRLITLGLDYFITLGGMALVTSVVLPYIRDPMGGSDAAASVAAVTMAFEVAVKLVAAVAVIIGNYIFSKIFVFRGDKSDPNGKSPENV